MTASESNPERDAAPHFDFQQLRLACELSELREERERLRDEREKMRADVGRFREKVEQDVEALRCGLAALGAGGLSDPARVMPLLERAVIALIEMRDFARALDDAEAQAAAGGGRRRVATPPARVGRSSAAMRTLTATLAAAARPTMPALPAFLAEERHRAASFAADSAADSVADSAGEHSVEDSAESSLLDPSAHGRHPASVAKIVDWLKPATR